MTQSNPVPDPTARQSIADVLAAVAEQLPQDDPEKGARTLAGMTTPAERAAAAAEAPADTLPQWLCQRYRRYAFPFDKRTWEQLPDDDRAYWAHEAAAVRRAVARDGFKAPTGGEQA